MDLFDVITKEIDEKADQLKDALAGGVSSFDEYRALCGEIKGLLFVKAYLRDLKQQLENSDNE